jgi:ribosomal protein L40E
MKKKIKLLSIAILFLVGALTLSMLSYQAKPATSGLVGSWKFDEGSGNIAHDSSGNGNDGTINGATWVTLNNGFALSFDGLHDYVTVPHSNTLVSPQFTIEAWIQLHADVGNMHERIVSKQETNERSYSLDIFGNGYDGSTGNQLVLNVGSGQSYPFLMSTTKLSIETWYFVVGTQEGRTSKLYINGKLDIEGTTTTQTTDNPAVLTIGCCAPSETDTSRHAFFNGAIDEVKIYNRALTSDEVYNDYIGEQTPFWMQWWFWTIIALGAIVVVLAFATVHYRKKPSFSKETSVMQSKTTQRANRVCPKCGANLPADSKFCGKCGTSLE